MTGRPVVLSPARWSDQSVLIAATLATLTACSAGAWIGGALIVTGRPVAGVTLVAAATIGARIVGRRAEARLRRDFDRMVG